MHLRDKHIEELLTMIDTWEPEVFGSLTWGRVLERFKKTVGDAPTERTLRNQGRLKARFNQKKEQIRNGETPVNRKPSSLKRAAEKIQKLEARVKALEEENEKLIHQNIVMQKNAMDYGIKKRELLKPLIITKDTERNLKGEV